MTICRGTLCWLKVYAKTFNLKLYSYCRQTCKISSLGDPRSSNNSIAYARMAGWFTLGEPMLQLIHYSSLVYFSQVVANYLGAKLALIFVPGAVIHWPGDNGPPPDVPPCGFQNENPECRGMVSTLIITWSHITRVCSQHKNYNTTSFIRFEPNISHITPVYPYR